MRTFTEAEVNGEALFVVELDAPDVEIHVIAIGDGRTVALWLDAEGRPLWIALAGMA